jgi:hypothetical protein
MRREHGLEWMAAVVSRRARFKAARSAGFVGQGAARANSIALTATTTTPYIEHAACASSSPLYHLAHTASVLEAGVDSLSRHIPSCLYDPGHMIWPAAYYLVYCTGQIQARPALNSWSHAARLRSIQTASSAPSLLARGAGVSGTGRSVL